jgi:acyl-CoA synthetase (NDP forming)
MRQSKLSDLQDKGIPVLASPERAARALGAMVQYTQMRDKIAKVMTERALKMLQFR